MALLLNHLWQSSLFVIGAGMIALALRRNGAHVRFWLWFAASIKFLLPFAALTALGAYALTPIVPPVAVPTVTLMEPLAKPFSAPTIVPAATVPLTIGSTAEPSARHLLPAHPALPARSALSAFPTAHIDLESALLALWAAGFLMLAIRWLVRWLRVRALLREAVKMPVDAPVAVKFSASRLEPGLVGILHPTILMPKGIEQQLSPTELQAVLAHELCHWRRHDNLLAAIHMLVEALFWFFPPVWWLGARLNAERERACDESVLAGGNDPRIYAEAILKVCRAYLQSPQACVAGVSGADLKKRIQAITENRLILRLNAARKFMLSASGTATLGVPLALGLMAAPITRMQAKAAPIPLPTQTAQRGAEQASPLAPETSTAALSANQVAENPSVGQALPANEPATMGVNAAPASPLLSRQMNPVVPSPDVSQMLPTQTLVTPALVAPNDPPAAPAQPASQTSPAATVADNDQPGAPNAAPAVAPNASGCAPPKLINSLPMEKVPGSDTMTVNATFEGNPEKMLVDIGRMPTQLWNTPAAKLHLAVQDAPSLDFGGRFFQGGARVQSFTLGNMQSGGFHIQIRPDPDTANAPFDGTIGNDVMWHYDVDLDFAHQKMNFFEPEQCKGAGVYWSPSTITSVPIVAYNGLEYSDRSPIPRLNTTYVPVTLDGHTIIALLDTRADRTFMNPDVASKIFGVNADSQDTANVSDGGTLIKARLHTFSSLSLGGLTANNPQIAIPLDITTQSTNIFHASKVARDTYSLHEILPDLVIGMDLLKHSHLYVSFRNDRVYVSAAGDGPALNPKPTSPTWINVY